MHKHLFFLILGSYLLIQGCGFHLRQTSALPASIEALSVKCQIPHDLICLRVKNELTSILSESANPLAVLTLTQPKLTNTAKSIDNKARAAEYEIDLAIEASLLHKASGIIVFKETINRKQRYRYQEENILAKEREQEEIINKLSKEAAHEILRQLKPLNEQRIHHLVQNNTESQTQQ